jgi:hypothetical protein
LTFALYQEYLLPALTAAQFSLMKISISLVFNLYTGEFKMKRFRKVCAALILTLMFALPAMAGEDQCTVAAPGDMGAGGRLGDPEPPRVMVMDYDLTATLLQALNGILIR